MGKQLIRQSLPIQQFKNIKMLTIGNIAIKLVRIFKNHIGREKAITRAVLFRKVFRKEEEPGFVDEFRWDYVKKALHMLRQRTNCFVGSEYSNGRWQFFVIKSKSDAQCYIDVLDKNIVRMRSMQQRAKRAVDEKWYQLSWINDKKLLR